MGDKPGRVFFSVGHSSQPTEALLENLLAHQIDRVVDVRTKPYSRFNPQYNRGALELFLADHDINYDWRGQSLGGLGENIRYEETLIELYKLAAAERIVLMCSEKQYIKCHRYLMITPDIERLGGTVVHI